MHAKLERLLSKSLTTLEVMAYYLAVHTGPGVCVIGSALGLVGPMSVYCDGETESLILQLLSRCGSTNNSLSKSVSGYTSMLLGR